VNGLYVTNRAASQEGTPGDNHNAIVLEFVQREQEITNIVKKMVRDHCYSLVVVVVIPLRHDVTDGRRSSGGIAFAIV